LLEGTSVAAKSSFGELLYKNRFLYFFTLHQLFHVFEHTLSPFEKKNYVTCEIDSTCAAAAAPTRDPLARRAPSNTATPHLRPRRSRARLTSHGRAHGHNKHSTAAQEEGEKKESCRRRHGAKPAEGTTAGLRDGVGTDLPRARGVPPHGRPRLHAQASQAACAAAPVREAQYKSVGAQAPLQFQNSFRSSEIWPYGHPPWPKMRHPHRPKKPT
jgi:hypothetical protein